MERKLTAILCADVFGYSRLMGENEEATLRTLSSHRKLIDSFIEQHHGRFVNSAGDSVLAEFASVVNAVQCAVEIQSTLKAENANVPPDRRMEFRIGVNLGDVMVDGEQIYGDGVNVAARLESLADPGGICISGKVHEEVGDKLALGYQDLGEQTVKNIAKPVRVLRVMLEGEAATRTTTKATERSLRKHWRGGVFSIAGLALIVGTIVLVQHLSLRPPATVAHPPRSSPPEVAQKVDFCRTSDGVRIAYATSGHGPAVVQVVGWLTSQSGSSNFFVTGQYLKRISTRHLFVRYDGRGSGFSDRGLHDYSLEPRVRDLEAVVDALRLGRFALYGDSAGAAPSVAYAATHPERVTRLVLYGGFAHQALREVERKKAFVSLIHDWWGGSDNPESRQLFASLMMPDASEADRRLFIEMERTSLTPEDAAALMLANFALDVTALAPKVRVPTLIIHRRGDLAVPLENGREMATLIPGARFMVVEGRNHVLLPDDPGAELINDAVEEFLDEDLPGK